MTPYHSIPVPLQFQIGDTVRQTLADVVAYLPTLIGALVILLVGWIVGRLLGGVVTRIVRRLGIGRYTDGTAMEEVGADSVARALGRLVAYYVYFVALVAAVDVLNIDLLTELLSDLGAFLPVVLGALAVLVVGFVVGRVIGDVVSGVVGGIGIGPYLRDTPLEQLGDTDGEFGRLVGRVVTYYVYLLTLLAVADILRVDALSAFLDELVAYLPALVGGLLVLLVGIWVAERVGGLVADAGDSRAVGLASVAVKVLIYYVAVTMALGAVGFSVAPLTNLFTAFVVAFLGALALALAIGIGVAVGLGGQEYVAENVDDWLSSAQETAMPEESEDGGDGSGDS
jgi:hypothetical protein